MDRGAAVDPEQARSWAEVLGAFLAGVLGLRGAQALVGGRGASSTDAAEKLDVIAAAIHEEGEASRRLLAAMRTDLAILLDREDVRRHTT